MWLYWRTFPSSCWIWILIHRIPMANKEEEYRRRTAPIDNKFHLSMAVASRQNLNQYIKQRIIRREPYATSLGPSHRRVFTNINWWIKRHQYAHIRPIHASNLATLHPFSIQVLRWNIYISLSAWWRRCGGWPPSRRRRNIKWRWMLVKQPPMLLMHGRKRKEEYVPSWGIHYWIWILKFNSDIAGRGMGSRCDRWPSGISLLLIFQSLDFNL